MFWGVLAFFHCGTEIGNPTGYVEFGSSKLNATDAVFFVPKLPPEALDGVIESNGLAARGMIQPANTKAQSSGANKNLSNALLLKYTSEGKFEPAIEARGDETDELPRVLRIERKSDERFYILFSDLVSVRGEFCSLLRLQSGKQPTCIDSESLPAHKWFWFDYKPNAELDAYFLAAEQGDAVIYKHQPLHISTLQQTVWSYSNEDFGVGLAIRQSGKTPTVYGENLWTARRFFQSQAGNIYGVECQQYAQTEGGLVLNVNTIWCEFKDAQVQNLGSDARTYVVAHTRPAAFFDSIARDTVTPFSINGVEQLLVSLPGDVPGRYAPLAAIDLNNLFAPNVIDITDNNPQGLNVDIIQPSYYASSSLFQTSSGKVIYMDRANTKMEVVQLYPEMALLYSDDSPNNQPPFGHYIQAFDTSGDQLVGNRCLIDRLMNDIDFYRGCQFFLLVNTVDGTMNDFESAFEYFEDWGTNNLTDLFVYSIRFQNDNKLIAIGQRLTVQNGIEKEATGDYLYYELDLSNQSQRLLFSSPELIYIGGF